MDFFPRVAHPLPGDFPICMPPIRTIFATGAKHLFNGKKSVAKWHKRLSATTGKGFYMITERPVFVTESEYKAIEQWEDDGGPPIDIVYVIIPDADVEQDSTQLQTTA